jgi:elongation factor 1 alpha-like protein
MPPKSGFSRTRNVDYDDDAYDDDEDYDEEEEAGDGMSETDKEKMRVGTVQVREALGEFEAGMSDAQIQEALWHYYYDVAKSVSYLKNKFGGAQQQDPQPKKEKIVSKFDQAASAATEKAPIPAGKYIHTRISTVEESAYPVALSLPPNAVPTCATDDFFWDVPWGNVPAHRLAIITLDAPCYRGGLLGGSSKLAALAAKKRKAREEADAAATPTLGAKPNGTDAAISMLDKLALNGKENAASVARGGDDRARRYPMRRRSPSPPPEPPEDELSEESEAPRPAIVVESPAQRASASLFASTLCGDGKSVPQAQIINPSPLYMGGNDYGGVKAFDGPSPDDVVRAAQAKVAGGGRR